MFSSGSPAPCQTESQMHPSVLAFTDCALLCLLPVWLLSSLLLSEDRASPYGRLVLASNFACSRGCSPVFDLAATGIASVHHHAWALLVCTSTPLEPPCGFLHVVSFGEGSLSISSTDRKYLAPSCTPHRFQRTPKLRDAHLSAIPSIVSRGFAAYSFTPQLSPSFTSQLGSQKACLQNLGLSSVLC